MTQQEKKEDWVEIDVSPEDTAPAKDPNPAVEETEPSVLENKPEDTITQDPPATPEASPPVKEEKRKERAETRIRSLAARARSLEETLEAERQQWLKEKEALLAKTHETEKSAISTGKATLEKSVEQAQAALEKAYNEADAPGIAKAIKDLSRAQLALDRLTEVEQDLPKEPPRVQAPARRAQGRPEALDQWIEKNPWFVDGPKQDRRAALMATQIGDELAKEGFDLHDPGFYEELDARLAEELPRLRKAPPVASPTRTASPTPAGTRPNVVRLTPEEVAWAKEFGMTPKEYAQLKQKQGTADNGYTPIV